MKVIAENPNAAHDVVVRLRVFLRQELPNEVMDEALAILLSNTRRRFLAQTSPEGDKWPESWAARGREKSGRGGGTLFDTGRLFHSIQALNHKNGMGEIYTDVPYGQKHQDGTDGMVMRRFLGMGPESRLIEMLIQRRLQEAANG